MLKAYCKSVFPAMLAFAFSGVYAIVDGLFVGNYIGDVGVSAINVSWPMVVFVQALGTGIGMSGAVNLAIAKAGGDKESERRYLGNTLVIVLVASALFTLLLSFLYPYLVHLFGGRDEIEEYANEYIKYLMWCAAVQIISTALLPIVRNYGGAFLAMSAMIAGFLTNVLLDWLMVSVLEWGMMGAALATVIGQFVTVIPCTAFLFYKKLLVRYAIFKPRAKECLTILKVGLSPFGLTLVPTLVVVILNISALEYGGNAAVSCYAVVNYVVCVVQYLMQGVGDGSQPLISTYYGEGNGKNVRNSVALSYVTALVTAFICLPAVYLLRDAIPQLFGSSPSVAADAAHVLSLFVWAFPCIAIMRVSTAYFYATKTNVFAYILIYSEPVVLAILIAAGIPKALGVEGLWICLPISQGILAFIAVILMLASVFLRRKKAARSAEKL